MQALAERLEEYVAGADLAAVQPFGFSGLKTFDPPPETLVGRTLVSTGRRGKYLILDFGGPRVFVHLSQAGRLDVEEPPKTTRGGKGGVVRLRFDNDVALLVREYGTERKAGWWVVGEGEVGPVEGLGPEPDSDEFADLILHGDDRRRVHTMLRDQRTVAGIGRGHTDDALWRAQLSPYATLTSLGTEGLRELVSHGDGWGTPQVLQSLVTISGPEQAPSGGGGLAAAFALDGTDGHRVTLASLLGKPLVINFWATYCPPCRAEMPLLQARVANLSSVRLVLIDEGDGAPSARAFLDSVGIHQAALLDSDLSVGREYGAAALPVTVFVRADGTVAARHIGQLDERALAAELSNLSGQ